jgi:hypothetical protein
MRPSADRLSGAARGRLAARMMPGDRERAVPERAVPECAVRPWDSDRARSGGIQTTGMGMSTARNMVMIMSMGRRCGCGCGCGTRSRRWWGSFARYTYGYGRAEDLGGLFVIVMITLFSVLAAYAAIDRLIHPRDVTHLWAVAVAAVIGFAGN